jgi:hypothetical protein
MKRPTTALLTVLALAFVGGCTLCDNCEDGAYPAFGGRWQRTDRHHGRVGSLFDPGGAKVPYPGDADAVGAGMLPRPVDPDAEELPEPREAEPRDPAPRPEPRPPRDLRDLELRDINHPGSPPRPLSY